MLKNLMKYDIKKMTKLLIWFYILAIGLAIITRLINLGNNIEFIKIIGMVFAGITYSAIFNILINTFIHILKSFLDSFYKDESYLTHTLPVKKETLLLSKYLSALLVVISSVVVSVVSILIIHYDAAFADFLKSVLSSAVVNLNLSAEMFVFLITILIAAQILAIMSFAFTAIVKGYFSNTKKSLRAVLWFIAFYFGAMLTTLLLAVITFAFSGSISQLFAEQLPGNLFVTLIILAICAYSAYAIIFYFICQKLFKKGVNVD